LRSDGIRRMLERSKQQQKQGQKKEGNGGGQIREEMKSVARQLYAALITDFHTSLSYGNSVVVRSAANLMQLYCSLDKPLLAVKLLPLIESDHPVM